MKKLFTSALVAITCIANSQTTPSQRCGSDVLPLQFENWVQSITPAPGKGGQNSTMSVFNIPVIVHIIHNNAPINSISATTGDNLNAAQVQDQINILNADFNGTNPDTSLIPAVFKPLLGKFQFNFCLAVVNPTGGIMPEPGIDRIDRNTKGWTAPPYSSTYVTGTIKPQSIWDVNRYFNMWVCNLSGGLLGFATFPAPGTSGLAGLPAPYGTATTDGVVMLGKAFGSIGTAVTNAPYHKGRTTTHEVGHWLGLRHIWGDGACANDFCNDTPTQNGANFGCPAFPKVTCSNGPNGDMHMNYMDYTDDLCMYMFTHDQKYRAQVIMTNSPIRLALLSSTVCNLPSVANDIGITFVSSPTYSQVINCNNFINPVIRVNNYGSTTITSATFNYQVDAGVSSSYSWTGSIAPSGSVNISLPQVSNLTNGAHVYSVNVTAPNGGTDANLSNNNNTQNFSITNSFTLSAAASPTTVCAGSSTTLTATGGAAGYTWTPGGITGTAVVVSPMATTIYTLTGGTGTCTNTRTLTVAVSSSLAVSATNATICAGSPATLTASGATTYTWNTGATGANLVVSPAATSVYTVNGNTGTCAGAQTATVTVNSTPTVSVNSSTICTGNAATLTASGAATYSWNTGATTAGISVSPASTTVYTVTGANGTCTNAKTTTVVVNTTPTVAVNSASICSGNTATLTASGAATYSWNTGATAAVINVNPSSTTMYTVTGTSNGCTNIKTSTVTVSPNPTVTVNSSTVCAGSGATLTATGASSYLWNTGATSGVITVTPASTTVYSVTGTSGGCTNAKTSTVTVNLPPVITSANNSPVCSGTSINLVASSSAGTTYSWNGPNGFSSSVQNPSISNATSANAGTYTVTATGGNGCTNKSNSTVLVNTTPTVSVNSFTICPGGSATLTASGASTYSWNTGATSNPIVVSPAVTTVYTTTGTTSGCSSSKTSTVTIGTALSVNVSPSAQTICSGNSTTISASGASTYTWSTGFVGSSIVVTPTANATYNVVGASGSCTGSNVASVNISAAASLNMNSINVLCNGMTNGSATVTPSGGASPYTYSYSNGATTQAATGLAAGNYTATVTTSLGCVSSTAFIITQPAALVLNTTIINSTCGNCNGAATYTATGGTGAYSYSFMPGGTSTNLCAGNYTAIITDGNGCSASAPVVVGGSSPMSSSAVSSSASCGTCADGSASVTVSGGSGPYTYTWAPAGGNNATATALLPGCYTVTISDQTACSSTATTCVGFLTGLVSNQIYAAVYIYPNPTNGNITLEFSNPAQRMIEVIDVTGRLIVLEKTSTQSLQLDLSLFSSGVYYINIKDGSGVKQAKVIKQ